MHFGSNRNMNKSPPMPHSMIRFFLMVLKTGKKQVLAQLFLRILCGLFPAGAALVWQRILASLQIEHSQQSLIPFFITLAIVGGLSASYAWFSEITDTLLRNRISLGLQKIIHKKADELPMDDYESPALADMLGRASGIFCYGDAIGFLMVVTGLMQQSVTIISMAVLVWSFDPLLAIAAFMLLIPGLVQLGLNRMRVNLELSLSPAWREAEVFRGYLSWRAYIKDIRMMNIHDFFLEKWESVTKHIFHEERRSSIRITLIRFLLDVMERGVTIGSYMLSVYLVLSQKISVAEFGAVIVLMGQFIQNSTWLMHMINAIHTEALSVRSAIGYFDLASETRGKTVSAIDTISVSNVSYTYPEAQRPAVKNITITLKKGETLALIGQNGSGKTTLSKLLLGLINPSQGEINADVQPMGEINYASLYNLSSAVFQDYLRYAMSVGDNITIADGRKTRNSGEIYQMLRDLGIAFIGENTSVNLGTELGVEFGGTDVSGGQWQQLAIARAAYRSAEVMVLDEPSSALDPLREAELYETFHRMCRNKIGVIITHRLGLCSFADNILVMDRGEVIEYGTKNQLLLNNGIFARMYRSQGELYTGAISES